MADDSDKTRIKGAPAAQSESPGGDETRIAARGGDEQRRLTAQKKARELEQRLAAISRKKNAAANTRVQPRRPVADETRIKPRAEATDSALGDVDSTQVQARPRPVANNSAAGDDKTVFKPATPPLDGDAGGAPTTLNELAASTPTSGGRVPIDLSQYRGQELLKNRFVFEKVLGAGGMGVVYKAKDLLKVEAQDRDPYVAIKVLSDEFKSHPEAFIALQRESRKTQRIAHPNIVNVHDFDRDGDNVFMTMEFLDGKPLDKLISQYRSTGLLEEDAWKILEGICAALIYAHKQSIIHSDFKPGNIFVTSAGGAKVFDFGIARAVAKAERLEESPDDRTVFDAGNLGALTPAYASLEMLEGETPDVRDDIYALGCIAYEMFTGEHPFSRVHADEAMRNKMKPKRIPNIAKRQWKVIEKALAFKREDRIESVEEFWRQLTHKRSGGVLFSAAAALVVVLTSFLVYQNYFAPQDSNFSEDEIRSEVERKFFIEQNQKDLAELLNDLEFSPSWEKRLWQAHENLAKLLGAEDPWLGEQRLRIYQAHLAKIEALIVEEGFIRAREILANTARYTEQTEALAALAKKIDAAATAVAQRIEEEKRRRDLAAKEKQKSDAVAKATKQKNEAFDVAMNTVNKQLQCRSTMNIRDIDIAVSKLRSLNPTRYRRAEADIVVKLAACIRSIGRSFPERAEEFKKRALRIFPANATVARIKIEPKDPCDLSLAGLGARGNRAICRDVLKSEGKTLGRGPALVVIPAKGSLKAFAIGKYEITVEDFNKFCAGGSSCEPVSASDDKLPLTGADIARVEQYLNWLSRKSKRQYRLPTKAEWMYAARANSAKIDPNRNCLLESRGIKKGGVLIKATTGQQNPWGLVNHLGNARELVIDGGAYAAVGGSYKTAIEECVVTKNARHDGRGDALTGFRLLRELEQTE